MKAIMRDRKNSTIEFIKIINALIFTAFIFIGESHAAPLPNFSDQALQICLDEQAIANSWLNSEDVTIFNCTGRNVETILGIESFSNLVELDLSGNQITNVSALNNFTQLTRLNLSGNTGIDFGLLLPIINQNHDLTHIGLNSISINGSMPLTTNQSKSSLTT